MPAAVRVKPKLRGVLHLVAALAAIPAAALLVVHSRATGTTGAAAVYGAGLVALLSVSAIYHVPHWSPRARVWLVRFDLSAICALIAASYAPVCLVILDPADGHPLFAVVWTGAIVGWVVAFFWPKAPRVIWAGILLLLGHAIWPYAPATFARIDGLEIGLMVAGGILFTLGAATYAARRPDPAPRVFGYHEVFHSLVVAACACHFVCFWRVLT